MIPRIPIHRHRLSRFLLLLPVLLITGVLTGASLAPLAIAQDQTENEEKDPEPANISDLESYQDMSVKPDSKREYWLKITFDRQWIGWAHIKTAILQTYRADGSKPINIYRYNYQHQIAPHLVRENLVDQIRQTVEKQKDELGIAAHEVDKIVRKRVESRFKDLQAVVSRRSSSSTIYLNDDRSFREAKYGRSAHESASFTLYLKTRDPGSGRVTVLVPDEVPKTIDLTEERKIVNAPLAASLLVNDQFRKNTYQYLFLTGTPDEPLARTRVNVLDPEWKERGIGEEKRPTRHLKLTLTHPDEGTSREEWWVDEKGRIQKMALLPPEDADRKPINFTRTSKQDAMQGLTFVFARRGRRDPFKPVWPKEIPERVAKKKDEVPEECKDYDPKKLFDTVQNIVAEKAPRSRNIDHRESRVRFQQTITRRFQSLKKKVMTCGTDQEKKQIGKLQTKLEKTFNLGEMILSIARDQLEAARKAFQQRLFGQIETHEQAILKWDDQLPQSAPDEVKEQYAATVKAIEKLKERAKIQKQFLESAPRIHGIVSSTEARSQNLTLGIGLFGERMSTRMEVSVPDVQSVAIIRSTQGETRQRAKKQNESLEISGLGTITVQSIHEDGVVFKYKGESIKVPLIKVDQTGGG